MKILLLGGNGYIGSKFYNLYSTQFDITSIDLKLFGEDLNFSTNLNYKNVQLEGYDVIVCLAGHSSVPMSEYNPENSWINNVEYFRELCKKLTTQKLIYASSASVYGNSEGINTENTSINFNPLNHYDLQKITIDLIANKYIKEGKNIVGLRFGTVNGASFNTRSDLMINSMTKSAIETGKIIVKNPQIHRAILGINDLMRVLEQFVKSKVQCGQYNVSSFNRTVGEIATAVSEQCKAEIEFIQNDVTVYNFQLSTSKLENEISFTFTDTVNTLIEELVNNHSVTYYSNRSNDQKFNDE